jgi:hypothetical protein
VCFKKYIKMIFFYFLKKYFWYQHIKTIQTYKNINIKKKIKFFKNTSITTFQTLPYFLKKPRILPFSILIFHQQHHLWYGKMKLRFKWQSLSNFLFKSLSFSLRIILIWLFYSLVIFLIYLYFFFENYSLYSKSK